jgi:hypothetical protein
MNEEYQDKRRYKTLLGKKLFRVQFNVDVVHVDVARLSPNCGPPTSLLFIPQIII